MRAKMLGKPLLSVMSKDSLVVYFMTLSTATLNRIPWLDKRQMINWKGFGREDSKLLNP
jgi:hypothetical protein